MKRKNKHGGKRTGAINGHGGKRSGSGRKKSVDRLEVVKLRRDPERYTWDQIGKILGVHRNTAARIYWEK